MSEAPKDHKYLIKTFSPPKQTKDFQDIRSIGKNSVYTIDTHYSESSCEESIPENEKIKEHPFKRIKEGLLNQKNNQGKIIKQNTFPSESPTRFKAIKSLDDAMTIFSNNSPRSVKSSILPIEESVIIMSGKDVNLEPLPKVKLLSPYYVEIFKYGNVLGLNMKCKENSTKCLELTKLKNKPLLALVPEIGILVFYEKQNNSPETYHKIFKVEFKGALKLFCTYPFSDENQVLAIKCHKKSKNLCLALYEPFNDYLTDYILAQSEIGNAEFFCWIQEIVSTLIELSKEFIFPQLDPSNIVLINKTVKIILRPGQINCCEKETVKSLGVYLHVHFKEMMKEREGRIVKLKGLNIFSKMDLSEFIESLLKKETICLAEINSQIKRIIETY